MNRIINGNRTNKGNRIVESLWRISVAGVLAACLAPAASVIAEPAQVVEDHEGNGEHEEARSVHLTPTEIEEFGIHLTRAEAGVIGRSIELAGEIVVNPDRFAHVVPRVGGVVRRVVTGLGDHVKAGTVMATIDSRELSELKSAYLAALERSELNQTSFRREERLWQQKISSEREYLQAKQAYAEASIESRSAAHKLYAVGFSAAELDVLPSHDDVSFSHFDIRAPFDGVVVQKHITLGESVDTSTEVFSVTDLHQVWAILAIYQKDLKWIRVGMAVAIQDHESGLRARATDRGDTGTTISYVSPVIDEATRTASIRVVIDNRLGRWRPGMFINGIVAADTTTAALVVPRASVQQLGDEEVVFVYDGTQFHLREVRTGRSTADLVEIVTGINVGETVASQGAFTLKTQIQKGEFESGHNH